MPITRNFGMSILANPSVLDRLIDWKLRSPATRHRSAISEGEPMQRQFTIELRVDYEDNDKNDEMRKSTASAARHMYAMAQLLADGVKPQIAIYSDDYFQGNKEIELLEDTIQTGHDSTELADVPVSSELMGAVRDQE